MHITGKGRRLHLVLLLMHIRKRSSLMTFSPYVMNLSIRHDVTECKQLVCTSVRDLSLPRVRTSDSATLGWVKLGLGCAEYHAK